jgi:hypothetical protein
MISTSDGLVTVIGGASESPLAGIVVVVLLSVVVMALWSLAASRCGDDKADRAMGNFERAITISNDASLCILKTRAVDE